MAINTWTYLYTYVKVVTVIECTLPCELKENNYDEQGTSENSQRSP